MIITYRTPQDNQRDFYTEHLHRFDRCKRAIDLFRNRLIMLNEGTHFPDPDLIEIRASVSAMPQYWEKFIYELELADKWARACESRNGVEFRISL